MDFIEGLTKSKGRDTILVMVDRLSKYAHFSALSHPFSALQVAPILLLDIIHLHGIPPVFCPIEIRFSSTVYGLNLFDYWGQHFAAAQPIAPNLIGKQKCLTIV